MKTERRPESGAGPRYARRRAAVLLAAAAWTLLVWITRIGILFGQQTVGFKVVHAVLIVGSLAAGVAVGAVGLALWREQRERPDAS